MSHALPSGAHPRQSDAPRRVTTIREDASFQTDPPLSPVPVSHSVVLKSRDLPPRRADGACGVHAGRDEGPQDEGTALYIAERVDTTYCIEGDFAPREIFVGFHTRLTHQYIVTLLVRTVYIRQSKAMLGKPSQLFLVGLVPVASILYGRMLVRFFDVSALLVPLNVLLRSPTARRSSRSHSDWLQAAERLGG